jgi:aminoglycoside phosphotransferase (APT) family kinase protein
LMARMPEFGEGYEEEPTLIHYRPDRRAVMRWGDVYLKVFAIDEHFERAVRGLEFSSKAPGIVAPKPVTTLPEYRISAQGAIPGEMPARLREARVKMGEALAQLHRAPLGSLPELTPTAFLDAVRTTVAIINRILPHLNAEVSGLVSMLETKLPAVVVPVVSHGDFHRRQAIAIDGGLALIDFDSICIAHPAYDVAKFAASQVNGRRGLERAFEWLEDLLEGYGRRPPDIEWHIAASILRRATKAFRFLSRDWPTRV